MNILFTHQFLKQVQKVKGKQLAKRTEAAILEVKNASLLSGITSLKDLKGLGNANRIRIGDYRIRIFSNQNNVEFSCYMHPKEIYRYFP